MKVRGFDTIGSATIIAYDGVPILTTDAWINGDAYFGSWTHDYEIPAEQLDAIRRAKFHWFSHGHPDHLNMDSLPQLGAGQILLSDHYGSRIARDLEAGGHRVKILPDRRWVPLSPSIRVYSIANQNQDSVLLIDVAGSLVIDLNDSPDFGASYQIRRIARGFSHVYCLQLHGWGGADMLNLFDPDGRKLTSPEELRRPIAPRAQRSAAIHGAHYAIPFSSFHRYQRSDSAWANALVPELEDYQTASIEGGPELLPAFVRVDSDDHSVTPIDPPRTPVLRKSPETFGDSWSDPLGAEDKAKIVNYFQEREALHKHFGFIEVRCGGSSVTVDLNPEKRGTGLTFDAPRSSFMTCIDYEIFDDLLIGNYMRTTLHGVESLYPHFSPYVAKYGDNGGAKSRAQLKAYFGHYYMRDPAGYALKALSTASEMVVRRLLPENSRLFSAAKRLYYSATTRGDRRRAA